MCGGIITRKVNILSAFQWRYREIAVQCGSNNQILAQQAKINTLLTLTHYWALILLQSYLDNKDWNITLIKTHFYQKRDQFKRN